MLTGTVPPHRPLANPSPQMRLRVNPDTVQAGLNYTHTVLISLTGRFSLFIMTISIELSMMLREGNMER